MKMQLKRRNINPSIRNRTSYTVLTAILGLQLLSAFGLPTASAATAIILDGNNINAGNTNGLTFKGFGVLSCNGTSGLLMDYKAANPAKYLELLNILFGGTNPIITHVKIEMGNDRNNSTGPEPCTMRTATETANVTRDPSFQLAADAKQINPNLKVSILRWEAPGWVSNNNQVYTWYKNTILAAYRQYGFMVDYVNPGINEQAPDLTWTKQYANSVRTDSTGFNSAQEQALYNSIKVIISDEVGVGTFGGNMVSDATLRAAVSACGYHYSTEDDSSGDFKNLATNYDIEVWSSEAQAALGNTAFRPNNNTKNPTVPGTGIGGSGGMLAVVNTLIKGFVDSRRTHFIYQPAIGSYYEGAQYSFKELISARDPWSGWIHYDAGLQALRHFSWFAKSGWENAANTAGISRVVPQSSYTGATGVNNVDGSSGAPVYMTLASPDKENFSTIFNNDSEYTLTYTLQTTNMGYTGTPSLEQWETRAADPGTAFNSNYMKFIGTVSATSGVYTITVKPRSIMTVTTLANSLNPAYSTPLPVEGGRTVLDTDATGLVQNTTDTVLYADNFDYTAQTVPVIGPGGTITGTQSYVDSRGGSQSVIPRYFNDRNGAFEAYLPPGSNTYVLRQMADKTVTPLGGTWNAGDPITGVGDFRWTDYKTSVDVSFENSSTASDNYAAIGARQIGGSSSHNMAGTPYWLKFWFNGDWQLLVNNTVVRSGNVVSGTGGVLINGFNATYNAWHNLAIQVVGANVTIYLDSVQLASYDGPMNELCGRVNLASGYYYTRFGNLRVETVPGTVPYYSEFLDDLEMNDLASPPAPKLVYSGSWAHQCSLSAYDYQRTLSTSLAAGAALQYTFVGTGLDILGQNAGTAILKVTVDGQVINANASTMASPQLYQTFRLGGLPYGTHTVQLAVVSGTLVVDAVGVLSAPTVPAAPSGLTATAGDAQVSLSWAAASGATGYNVKSSTVSGGPYATIASNVTSLVFTNTGLINGTTYYYVVSATSDAGESPNSTGANATPLSAFQSWQLKYFGCTNCPAADPNADPLGKGISNTNQFLLGLNPTNSASAFRILSIMPQGSDVSVTWQTAGGRTNAVQVASGDTSGGYSNNFVDIPSSRTILSGTGDAVTNYTDFGAATNGPSRFYRVRLVP